MTTEDQQKMLEQQLEKYPALGLDPDQVAEALGVTRRYVDKLLDDGHIKYFVLDPSRQHKQKRVTKAALIAYITNNTIGKGD
jgi:excisionase family DNA binding protein